MALSAVTRTQRRLIGYAGLLAVVAAALLLRRGTRASSATDDGASASAARPGAQSTGSGSGTDPRSSSRPAMPRVASSLPSAHADSRLASAARDGGTDLAAVPNRYELSRLGNGAIAVNLTGGPSELTSLSDHAAAPAEGRVVRGRVTTRGGAPVADAVVVVSGILAERNGHLLADEGATSDANGTFEIPHVPRDAQFLMAAHPRLGWSPVVRVPAGSDAVIDVQIEPAGTLRGQVTRQGRAERAQIFVQGQPQPQANVETDDEGNYVVASLPEGSYRVTAGLAQGIGTGASRPTVSEVVIRSGETTQQDFQLAAGIVLAVDVTVPPGIESQAITYTLIRGDVHAGDEAHLDAACHAMPAGTCRQMVHGGQTAAALMQFHDLDPGSYEVCAEFRGVDQQRRFGCTGADLAADAGVKEVTIDLSRDASR